MSDRLDNLVLIQTEIDEMLAAKIKNVEQARILKILLECQILLRDNSGGKQPSGVELATVQKMFDNGAA